ncbi:ER membrane protein complex subunit 4 isoform X2 [Chroicocephalus ridibundus]|uniref:ER membrane protein complex subunit 4 isoform X2 n=1 Tax=Chroicocephalus ridibundus TaxID=1192867 RepID=UPI002FDD23FC
MVQGALCGAPGPSHVTIPRDSPSPFGLSQDGGGGGSGAALQVVVGARGGAGRARCWDVALAPLKQIPMNLFIMYMAGNTISIFPAMMVCMMGWRPLQALMSLSATLKALESSSRRALQGLVFLVGNGLGLALALYKCQAMGLLPTRPSDWLAFVAPPQRMEFTGGGLIL